MNIEEIRNYCLEKHLTTEEFPFDEVTLVIKVCGKIFAVIPLDSEEKCIALKCDPEHAIELRDQYEEISPAYHFNKKYWNSILLCDKLSDSLIKEWIDDSYNEVVKKMSKKQRDEISMKQ